MKFIFSASVFILLLASASRAAQPDAEKLATQVEHFFGKMYAAMQSSNNVTGFKAEYENTLHPTTGAPVSGTSFFVRKGSDTYFASDMFEVWNLSGKIYMISTSLRSITVSRMQPGADNGNIAKMKEFVDLIFANPASIVASEVRGGLLKLVLTPENSIAREMKMSQIVFIYSPIKNTVISMETMFLIGHTYKRQMLRYSAIDFNYPAFELGPGALSKILDKQGRPTGKYKGYTINDMR